MFNIIKADINRIRKSKSIWIMPLIIFVMVTIICGLFAGLNYVMSLDLSSILGDNANALSSIGSFANNGYDMTIMNLQSDTMIYVFLVILLSVSAFDFSSGTVKNLLSIGKSKSKIYFSKLITSYIWAIIGVVFYAIISTCMSYIFFQDAITFDNIKNIFVITIRHIPVYLAVLTIGHVFVFATQKVAPTMLLYIGTFMFFETIMPIIDMILDWPIKISLIMPIYQLVELTAQNVSVTSYLTIYIVSLLYILCGAFGGYYLFKKEEIK